MASTLSDASGVSTLTAPSVCFQYCHTPSSAARAASTPRKRSASCRASSAFAPAPSVNTIWRSSPGARSKAACMAAHGSRPAPIFPDSRARVIAAGEPSVPLRPRNSRRSPVTRARRLAGAEERHPAGELGVVGIAREDRAAGGVHFRDHVHRGFRPQVAQHPLHVAGGGEPAHAAGIVADLQHRELHRRVGGHVHPDLRADSALAVLEHAVAESVPAHVRLHAPARHGHGRPEVPGLLVAKIIGLAAGVAHRIVAPRSQAELVRVFRPGIGHRRSRRPRFRSSRSPARSPRARASPGCSVVVMMYSRPSGVNPPSPL